jgi:hypothetical protein
MFINFYICKNHAILLPPPYQPIDFNEILKHHPVHPFPKCKKILHFSGSFSGAKRVKKSQNIGKTYTIQQVMKL